MAYAAVISLKCTVDRLHSSRTSIVPNSSLQIIESLREEANSLRSSFEWYRMKNGRSVITTCLDRQIRDAVREFEDVLESHVWNQIISQSKQCCLDDGRIPLLFSLDLSELRQDVDSFTQMAKAYVDRLQNPLSDEEDDDDDVIDNLGGNSYSGMVGLSDQFTKIRDRMVAKLPSILKGTISLWGMAGIGKTTLAKKLFHDPLISTRFDTRAFVTVGQKYEFKRVLLDILKQIVISHETGVEGNVLIMEGEEMLDGLRRTISESLMDRRYLIVLDDVWDRPAWTHLVRLFPWQPNGSRVLVTTREKDVAKHAERGSQYDIRFLDEKESWDLLRKMVFAGEEYNHELEKLGKKIAENCEGLPLTIVKVADNLSKSEKTPEYWKKVAADKQNSVFTDAYDQMSKVLYSSYNYFVEDLKASFLYMGVFPQNCEIPCSKLFNLLITEGLIESKYSSAKELFEKLVSSSLAVVRERSFAMKIVSLHSPFWYLCNKEARKSKFFHSINSLADGLAQDIQCQRRLCIRKNILFGIEEVHNSMASISMVRSLMCTGSYHQYPVPVCLGLRLLRILNALTIRFYEFPTEVLELVQLRYIALTYDGNLPSYLSKLCNLEYLIVHRHLRVVKSDVNSSYLPIKIWDMTELKHLEIMGRNLPEPKCEGSLLPNLLTLLDVSAQSCTRDVLVRIPHLKKLRIRIELAPGDADEPLCFFDHISHLHELESLKCVIVNPRIMSGVVIVAPPAPLSLFSASLVKLTLSGFGYPWEEMSKISLSLPNLTILKLRCYAFGGPKWELRENEFPKLRLLLIEDTDLVHWTFPDCSGLPALQRLSIRHCYKLQEIPLEFGSSLEKFELVECNHTTSNYAKNLKESWDKTYTYLTPLDLNVHSSWDI